MGLFWKRQGLFQACVPQQGPEEASRKQKAELHGPVRRKGCPESLKILLVVCRKTPTEVKGREKKKE